MPCRCRVGRGTRDAHFLRTAHTVAMKIVWASSRRGKSNHSMQAFHRKKCLVTLAKTSDLVDPATALITPMCCSLSPGLWAHTTAVLHAQHTWS